MKIILILFILFSELSFAKNKNIEEILNSALLKNEEVLSKESEFRDSQTDLTKAQINFAPDLSLVGSYSEFGEEFNSRTHTRSYGLSSSLNFFKFGGDYYNLKAVDAALEMSQWKIQSAKISQEEIISFKLMELISKHQEVEIRKKLFSSQKENSKIAEKRFEKGILPKQELDKVWIDSQIAEARLKDAELAENQARENLKVFVDEELIDLNWPWVLSFKKFKKNEFAFNVENHLDWKALKNYTISNQYKLKTTESEIWPSLDLNVSYQNQNSASAGTKWTAQWSGLVTLTIPLFSKYVNVAASKQSREAMIRSELTLNKTKRELETQWKTALTDFSVQLESSIQREKTLILSRSLYQDNYQRFQTGRSNANDLFNDQERLYQTELLAVQGWYSVHLSYIKLCHSMGLLIEQCLQK